jgi:hypothetical protein
MKIENNNIKNLANETINPIENETVFLLRKMVKMLESNIVVDANMRQRIVVEILANIYGIYGIGANGTNYPTTSTPSAYTAVSYLATWAGPIDPRWTNIEQARINYNTRIRKNLI